MSQAGRPILGKPTLVDVNYRGEKIKKGAQLWLLGTDTAKSLIYGRLKVSEPGPGCIHFSRELESEYFAQLTSERLVTRYVKGRPRLEWVKPAGVRNEALDLEVYALAAAHKIGINRYKSPDWDRIEQLVQPAQPDLLEPQDASAPTPGMQTSARQPTNGTRPRGGFVSRWRRG